jgi:hypothetical protein
MSLLRRDTPPPTDSWERLREWARHSWWHRFRESVLMMLPFTTVLLLLAGVILLFAESSWRSVRLIGALWAVCVPLAGLGQMRRLDRSAAQVPPISAASLNPTTAVDIRSANDHSRG